MAPALGVRVGVTEGAGIPSRWRDIRFSPTCHANRKTIVVLSACCKERSIAITYGAPRYKPSAGQRTSPGTVVRFPSSRRGFDSRHPLHHELQLGSILFLVIDGVEGPRATHVPLIHRDESAGRWTNP